MDNQELSQKLVDQTLQLLTRMNIAGTVECRCDDEKERKIAAVVIKTQDSALLIGQKGANLSALQYIVQKIAQKAVGDGVFVSLDVNDYKARRQQELVGMAKRAASDVERGRRTITLRPMSAAERRIIHMTLADLKTVKTESIGREPNRRVIIRPAQEPTVDEFSSQISL